jgi:hypothetical protein
MFRAKGFSPRGPDPVKGLGGFVDPKTGRSYHIDPQNSFGEPPHVDVNRLKTYKGPLDKKKYEYTKGQPGMLLTIEYQSEAQELDIVCDGEGIELLMDRLKKLKDGGGDTHTS